MGKFSFQGMPTFTCVQDSCHILHFYDGDNEQKVYTHACVICVLLLCIDDVSVNNNGGSTLVAKYRVYACFVIYLYDSCSIPFIIFSTPRAGMIWCKKQKEHVAEKGALVCFALSRLN